MVELPQWVRRHLLLRVRVGSQAHGLATTHSDHDSRGICFPLKEHLLGLSSFEQWESDGGDHVVYALAKFVRLALEGNPNIIETLYVEDDDILFCSPAGERLLAARDLFLSRRVGQRFGRYAIHQLKRLERHYRWLTEAPPVEPKPADFGAVMDQQNPRFPDTAAEKAFRAAVKHYAAYRTWRKNRNPKRAELEERFGYDTKHAMHLCRLLKMGQEILSTGEVLVRRPDADWLRSVREGLFSYGELVAWSEAQEQALNAAEASSRLPVEPDSARVEALVVELTEDFFWG